ncbi:protein translation factor SUI1 homolog 1-like [Aegilops tauschii subsp. strangulata]|nr:protein translation factor SUI1 homolog 2-like [Aegilops tauschii subsp. strangulata]
MPAGGAPDPFADNDALPPSSFDPFADARADDAAGGGAGVDDAYVHLRVQQRNGKKTLTTVQGLSASYNYAKVLRDLKRELCCNGTVVEDKELGNVIQLQGDHRERVAGFLAKAGLAKTECIKVHGF